MAKESSYFSQIRQEISPLLPSNTNVALEIGCGSGETLNWLKENNFVNHTIGFEINEVAASQARLKCDEVLVGNIEESVSILKKFEKSIDLLLFLDVIEHLNNPWTILKSCQTLLSDQGIIIASIPNVRSVKVLSPLLLNGEWNYQNSGILDKTHLRFFTKKSCIKLFQTTGYKIEKVVGNGPLKRENAKTVKGNVMAILNLLTLNIFEEFIANQYLILAKPLSKSRSE